MKSATYLNLKKYKKVRSAKDAAREIKIVLMRFSSSFTYFTNFLNVIRRIEIFDI